MKTCVLPDSHHTHEPTTSQVIAGIAQGSDKARIILSTIEGLCAAIVAQLSPETTHTHSPPDTECTVVTKLLCQLHAARAAQEMARVCRVGCASYVWMCLYVFVYACVCVSIACVNVCDHLPSRLLWGASRTREP